MGLEGAGGIIRFRHVYIGAGGEGSDGAVINGRHTRSRWISAVFICLLHEAEELELPPWCPKLVEILAGVT